ncbi:RING finger protein 215 isoform X1 [Scleropages formosus]|uniref:RING finger protein 215 isoform X1 n=1 Tax=Scleropages formosus TaxID=113540 RepID=UPI0010FACC82|nr:RING finger protein 215 isoform X1 [Scleropages formosus]
MAADGCWRCVSVLWAVVARAFLQCAAVSGAQQVASTSSSAGQVAAVEVFLKDRAQLTAALQGEVVEGSWPGDERAAEDFRKELRRETVQGHLRVVQDEELDLQDQPEGKEPWIGVVPVKVDESEAPNGNQESFAAAVVNRMKRALVLGASALIILALNQNTIREMDLSQVLSKPVIVIQTSENVTKLIGALLRGLQATAKITYKTILQDNLGATLTLWSSCGRSRGGLYGEWQGVICTGETNSQVQVGPPDARELRVRVVRPGSRDSQLEGHRTITVPLRPQKYLQQLWNTVLWVAMILCTGVIVQARWQYRDRQGNDDVELLPKQDILRRLAALKTRKYHPPKAWCDAGQAGDADNCAVCLEQFYNNQCLRVLPCMHEFHRDCVDPWLLLQQTCPLCKRSILGNLRKES